MADTQIETEPYDPLTDTGKKAVAEAVRRIKAEYEMNRAMLRDDLRQVLREHDRERRRFWQVHIEKACRYLFGIVDIDDK